jgi:hypothetical protein
MAKTNKYEILTAILSTKTKRQLIGAGLSAMIACLCLVGLYMKTFSVDISDSTALEKALNAYFFTEDVSAKVVQQQEVGNRLILLFEREGYAGHYGIAYLERGFMGGYRFIKATLNDWPLYNESFDRDKELLLLYGINALPDVADYAVYPFDDTSAEPIYKGPVEAVPFLRVITLNRQEDYIGAQFVHYYDASGKELDQKTLRKTIPEPAEGRTPSVGTAERSLPYIYMGIVIILGIVFVRYFLTLDR